MTQVKRDPHRAGYVYQPDHMVTAILPPGADVETLRREFAAAGFPTDAVQAFRGQVGAEHLDLKGERHGGWVRFRRDLERLFHSYETWVFDQAEQALWAGGTVAAVATGGDEARKARAVELMKAHGGRGVRYWSPTAMEIYF